MTNEQKVRKAYECGWADYARGRPAEANPYRASTNNEENLAWLRGWRECPAPGSEGGF